MTRCGTIQNRALELMPTMFREILASRSGGRGEARTDTEIRREFNLRHRELMSELERLGPGDWFDNESLSVAAWIAFEMAMADSRADPEQVARAEVEAIRTKVRRMVRIPGRSLNGWERRFLADLARDFLSTAAIGPIHREAIDRHLARVIDEEIAALAVS